MKPLGNRTRQADALQIARPVGGLRSVAGGLRLWDLDLLKRPEEPAILWSPPNPNRATVVADFLVIYFQYSHSTPLTNIMAPCSC